MTFGAAGEQLTRGVGETCDAAVECERWHYGGEGRIERHERGPCGEPPTPRWCGQRMWDPERMRVATRFDGDCDGRWEHCRFTYTLADGRTESVDNPSCSGFLAE